MQANRHVYADLLGRRRFADAAVSMLADAGTRVLFGMPAESLNALIDAVRRDGRIQLIGVRHEGAGALMAATYGKLTGEPGVCMGTAGPGATHLPLGVYEARADRAPLVALSGQVPAEHLGLDSFQEIDPVALMGGAALYNQHIGSPRQLGVLGRALAESALRRGPAHVACSSDVFAAPVAGAPVARIGRPGAGTTADKTTLTGAAAMLSEPGTLLVVGAVNGELALPVERLAERIGAPVLVLAEGHRHLGAVPDGRAVPVLREGAEAHAELLARCARAVVVGPATASVEALVGGRVPVIQVADGAEGAHPGPAGWLRLLGDPAGIIDRLAALADRRPDGALAAEADKLRGRARTPLWDALDDALPDDAILAVESGALLDGALRGLPFRDRLMTSSYGLGAGGNAVPAAIGACFARPGRPVVAVTTDGGLQDFAAELLTLSRYRIPVTVVCVEGTGEADTRRLAAASGLRARRVEDVARLADAVATAAEGPGPALVTVPAAPPEREKIAVRAAGAGTIAAALVALLAETGAEEAFVRPSDATAPLTEACRAAGVAVRPVRNPESAAMTASAVAKYTGRTTLCVTAGGADAILQLNGVFDACFDHAPVVVLAARAAVVDGTRLFDGVARTVRLDGTPGSLAETARVLRGTARGVVLVEVDTTALDRTAEEYVTEPPEHAPAPVLPSEADLDAAVGRLAAARRPVILAGRGGRGAGNEIAELAAMLQAPVVTTMPGRGTVPDDHRHFAGAVGSSGHQCATETLESADVCLAFGISRRGASAFDLPGDFALIQVDHDLVQLANAPRADLALNGAARETAQALTERLGAAAVPDPAKAALVRERHRRFLATRRRTSRIPAPAARPIRPSSLALAMAAALPRSLVTVDVGLTTLWVYRYMTGRHDFVWTSSFATMGFAVPAAAGLARAAGDRPVVAAVGDGGIAVTLSELGSLRDLDLPVVVVVFNNGKLGAIKFEQEIMGWPEYGSALHNGDLAEIARAYGLAAERVTTMAGLRRALNVAALAKRPFLIDVVCDWGEIPSPAQGRPAASQVAGYLLALAREGRRRLRGGGPEDGPLISGRTSS
ncbi:thiamine pyrophosphate-dependent enzyme [Actinomadura sp. DC4]|uniref:thiamine pyrophosphate-binding protein n=1 Tax=Actinomadura sp. DC4 TaxID=3055069 RepID=UPI0025B12830|nr:thiamine pyrophosphate-dependent enzyme [Actinomadura sp. DC4]MDN3351173.1 thiamine pyrophosphate-binding protein [Actinomadura sp. DC4]